MLSFMDLGRRAGVELRSAFYAFRAGVLAAEPPRQTLRALKALDRLGQVGAALAITAMRHPDRVGLIDERGSLTFGELDARASALACGLRARGVGERDCVGILCRNHRGFLDATFG